MVDEFEGIFVDDIQFRSIWKEDVFLIEELILEEYKWLIIYYFLKKYENDVIKVVEKFDIGKLMIYCMLKEEKEDVEQVG